MKLHRPVNGGGRRRRWNTRRVSMALLALVLVGLIALSTFAYSSGPATTSIGTRGETADRQRPTKGGGKPTSAPGSNGTRFGRTENGESKVWVEKDDFDSKRQLLHVTSDHYSMIYPIITVRDQRDETSEGGKQVKRSSRWHRRFKFSEAMDTFPLWARSEEKDTLEHASIFVSIAAFRDVECVTTVKSLFSGALSHHRIYVGISEELAEGDKRCIDMINPSNNDEEMRSMLWGSKSDIPLFRRSFSWDELMKDRADIRLTSEIVGPMEVGKKDKTHQQKAQTLSVEDNRSQSPDSVSPSTDSAPSGSPSRGTSTDQQSRKVSAGTNESTKTASMLKSNSTTTTTSTANITKVTQTFSASATNSSTMKNASTIAGISMNTTTHTAPAANTTTSTSAPNSTSTTASPVSTGHASKGVGFGIPNGVFLDPTYKEEKLQCIGGVVERVRDEFLLAQWKKDKKTAPVPLRMGRGGLQELPSPALAGCRIISRVTSHNYARGPTFGRYITSLLAFNQDYFMIVDSHSRFSNHWDAKMILRVFQMNTRGILSHYPNGYTPRKPHAEESKTEVMLMCKGVILTNGMPKLGARWTRVKPYPELEAFAAAGYMFGDAQFVLDVPFDPFLPYLFDGEEVIFSARLWTSGWDIYGPSEANVLHNYDRGASPRYFSLMTAYRTSQKIKSERRGLYLLRRAFPWEQVKHLHTSYVPPEQRPIISATESSTSLPLRAHEEYYGIGTVRSLDDYWTFTQLSDKFVREKDNEGRWAGGEGLCNGGA